MVALRFYITSPGIKKSRNAVTIGRIVLGETKLSLEVAARIFGLESAPTGYEVLLEFFDPFNYPNSDRKFHEISELRSGNA
ncbi:MAG: hypothetical protein WCI18_13420 [Pseudomonadota bacterium]